LTKTNNNFIFHAIYSTILCNIPSSTHSLLKATKIYIPHALRCTFTKKLCTTCSLAKPAKISSLCIPIKNPLISQLQKPFNNKLQIFLIFQDLFLSHQQGSFENLEIKLVVQGTIPTIKNFAQFLIFKVFSLSWRRRLWKIERQFGETRGSFGIHTVTCALS